MACLNKLSNGSSLHIHHFLHCPQDHSFLQLKKKQNGPISSFFNLGTFLTEAINRSLTNEE